MTLDVHLSSRSGSFQAFAAMLVDGRVVTWGSPNSGGNCSEIKEQLALSKKDGTMKVIWCVAGMG